MKRVQCFLVHSFPSRFWKVEMVCEGDEADNLSRGGIKYVSLSADLYLQLSFIHACIHSFIRQHLFKCDMVLC